MAAPTAPPPITTAAMPWSGSGISAAAEQAYLAALKREPGHHQDALHNLATAAGQRPTGSPDCQAPEVLASVLSPSAASDNPALLRPVPCWSSGCARRPSAVLLKVEEPW